MKTVHRLIGMTVSSVLLCAGNLCINASKGPDGKIQYFSVTATLLVEVLKFSLFVLAICLHDTPVREQLRHISLMEVGFYAVPSFLYMIDNNLAYVILRFVDPATLSVLWNLKILTTAVLFRLVLKKKLSQLKQIAILLLLLGVVTSQSDHAKASEPHQVITHSSITNKHISIPSNSLSVNRTRNEPLVNSTGFGIASSGFSSGSGSGAGNASASDLRGSSILGFSLNADDLEANNAGFIFGVLLIGIGVTISSCASVFTEWTFKRKSSNCGFVLQNTQLYAFGIFFNLLGVLFEMPKIQQEGGFFKGYNTWTWIVILVNSLGGICVGFVLKYLDNIACAYAHAMAMMLTMLISMVFFDFYPSLEFACGLSVSLVSMYLYHHKFTDEHARSDGQHKEDDEDDEDDNDQDDDEDQRANGVCERDPSSGSDQEQQIKRKMLAPGVNNSSNSHHGKEIALISSHRHPHRYEQVAQTQEEEEEEEGTAAHQHDMA